MYFILTRTMETNNSDFYFTPWHNHILRTPPGAVSLLRENRKEVCVALSFRFVLRHICITHGWLTQGHNMSKKEYDRVAWLLLVLRNLLPSFLHLTAFLHKSAYSGKHGLCGGWHSA